MKFRNKFHQKNLNTQIIIIITFIVIIFMSIYIAWGSYNQYQLAMKHLHHNTSLLAKELIATRVFIAEKQDEINIDRDGTVNFKHLNPSVAIRGISEIFNGTEGYFFKQTHLSVRNLSNAPDLYEKLILEKFIQDTNLIEYYSIDSSINGNKTYRYMVPLYYEEGCLSCHGEPAGEKDITGHFKEGAHLGDFAGAISITAPLDRTYQDLKVSLIRDLLSVLILLLSITSAVYLVIRFKVVKPLERMASLANRFGKGELHIPAPTELYRADYYEIRVLQNNLFAMANNLKGFYETLETQVDQRTQELRKANEALRIHQENLHQINEELTKANAVKSEFIALMSHELQTPLTSIIAYSEILMQQESGNPETTEYLFDIYQSALHLLDLITDLLDFSKIEQNKMKIHPIFFEFSEIMEVIENIFRPIIQKNNLLLTIDMPSNLPVIQADKNKVKQILMNILSNAIKFTPSGGKINIQVLYDNIKEELQISISDTGRGIENDKLIQIFDKFYQVDSGTSRAYGGLGLGLAVTKQMIELHRGTIWVESTLGLGSTFHFTLPIFAHPNT